MFLTITRVKNGARHNSPIAATYSSTNNSESGVETSELAPVPGRSNQHIRPHKKAKSLIHVRGRVHNLLHQRHTD